MLNHLFGNSFLQIGKVLAFCALQKGSSAQFSILCFILQQIVEIELQKKCENYKYAFGVLRSIVLFANPLSILGKHP